MGVILSTIASCGMSPCEAPGGALLRKASPAHSMNPECACVKRKRTHGSSVASHLALGSGNARPRGVGLGDDGLGTIIHGGGKKGKDAKEGSHVGLPQRGARKGGIGCGARGAWRRRELGGGAVDD